MTKIFDTPDGSTIEVRSNNAQLWRPDTCRCVLVFEVDTQELDFAIHVCELHKTVATGRLVSEVLNHNNTINGTNPTPTEAENLIITKAR